MSIFKESFRDYVKKQFNIRQKVISRGNSDIGSTSRLTGTTSLEPGAFYAYGEKQCVIRMASLVDLMEDVGLDLGGSNFESYKGETFARNFILEGGVLSDYARNNSSGEGELRSVNEVRGGFPKPTKRVNLSYGDPSLAADPRAGEDGYGVVPMPGIVDATIETKSAYGSLRSAKVNFVCHNLRQLEILELLYMRPGYPVLMEWGWSPYIGNDGKIKNTFPSIANKNWFWDDNQVSQERIQREVIRLKQVTNGNYDGFIGFITNFNYTSRPDGGFNCTTELISMGEVLNSLKVPSFGYSNISNINLDNLSSEKKEKLIYNSSLGIVIQDIINIANGKIIIDEVKKSGGIALGGGGPYGGNFANSQMAYDISKENILKAKDEIKISTEKIVDTLGEDVFNEVFIIKEETVFKKEGESIQSAQGYIRWDALVLLINEFVIPTNEKGQKPFILETNLYRPSEISGKIILDPILYSSYTDINDQIIDTSCDPKVCILPHQFNQFKDDEINLTSRQRIGMFFNSSIPGLNLGDRWELIKTAFKAESAIDSNNFKNLTITPETAERRIGGIYIGVEYLDSIFKNTFQNKDVTLGDFLKKLWDGINEQCPMHNFGLRVDHEFTDIVQIIDLPIASKDLEELDFNTLFKFNVHSNDTIVRDFSYSTQIPDAMKATIAINAQSGATADDVDSVTFAAFNKSIKSRLHSLEIKFSKKERINYEALRQETENHKRYIRLKELKSKIQEYNELFFNFIETDENDFSVWGNIKNIIQELQSIENNLEKTSSGYLKNQSVIPINVNLVIDGISGVIIGNVFRVDETRLPKAYRKSNIAFIVMGESQTITSGQDWTTNIRGQMIIFPTEREITKKNEKTSTYVDPDPTENVERINERFAVAESTAVNTTSINSQIQQINEVFENQQIDNQLSIIENLGYTPEEIEVLISLNDIEYVINNNISPNEYQNPTQRLFSINN